MLLVPSIFPAIASAASSTIDRLDRADFPASLSDAGNP
jgi:hypothetical protein